MFPEYHMFVDIKERCYTLFPYVIIKATLFHLSFSGHCLLSDFWYFFTFDGTNCMSVSFLGDAMGQIAPYHSSFMLLI